MSWDDNEKGGGNKSPWGNRPNGGRQQSNEPDIDEFIRKGQEKIQSIFSGGGGKNDNGLPQKNVIFILISIAAILWLASGIYTVNTKEEGVVLRFGEYTRTTKPGLNYHLPSPIEKVIKVRVTDRYTTEIGNASRFDRRTRRDQGSKELLMLTGDENIVSVNAEVQWEIANARKFLFNVSDPVDTLKDAAESSMREIIGTTSINSILANQVINSSDQNELEASGSGREAVQLNAKKLLQSILDSYDSGIDVKEVNMKALPPSASISIKVFSRNDDGSIRYDENNNPVMENVVTTVEKAFKDVQAANAERQDLINKASARSNELIPEARGEAEKILQEAEGYKSEVVAKAEGEAKRFLSVYNEYKNAKDVTKRRIYLETMEQVLNEKDIIILDTGKNGVLPYLPLNELKK
ncbi:protease modulator HflK [Rickettsiales bacterium]|nr:protease modulator HflK [Rickettsiales bacterium]